MKRLMLAFCGALLFAAGPVLETAVESQDLDALKKLVAEAKAAAEKKPNDAAALARVALTISRLAEVSMELGDKKSSAAAAESGIPAAEKAVALAPKSSENHRLLGTLCGQVVPANPLAGLSKGRCALDEVAKALELDPKSSMAYLSRGVGNYYLPPLFGGGVDKAIADMRKAVELDAKNAEAQVWLGVALRKAGHNADARAAFEQALKLNPRRKWARQQLDKTPKT